MAYKIAIASSDGENVDLSFGAAESFYIYDVNGVEFALSEERILGSGEDAALQNPSGGCESGCGGGSGCGASSQKVESLSDCRSIVCRKIGFGVTKQLEKKAISGFSVECSVTEALEKIASYYDKVDSHQSLREEKL